MPKSVKCYVIGCNNYYSFRFPKNLRRAWLEAIGRPDDDPKPFNGLCAEHFYPDDFSVEDSTTGLPLVKRRLRTTVIPSRNIPKGPPLKKPRKEPIISSSCADNFQVGPVPVGGTQHFTTGEPARSIGSENLPKSEVDSVRNDAQGLAIHIKVEPEIPSELECGGETVTSHESEVREPYHFVKLEPTDFSEFENENETAPLHHEEVTEDRPDCIVDNNVDPLANNVDPLDSKVDPLDIQARDNNLKGSAAPKRKGPKSKKKQKYDVHDYEDRPEVIKYFTGLETYYKFMAVFQSLRTDIFPVTYRDSKVAVLSLENQFFLTIWKLKRDTTDFELGEHFGVSRTTVSNIFTSMVSFIAEQWGKSNVWPSRSLTDLYMPDSFKKACPSKGETLDVTDSKARIERLVGLTKMYRMLTHELDPRYVPLASQIFYVCVMVCNFRENSVSQPK